MRLFGVPQWWQQKSNNFIDRRTPRQDERHFGLSNVYVFFSWRGLLFVLLLGTTFITGVNYGNNLVLGLFFYLFAVWFVGVFYTFVQISSLSVRFVGATLTPAEDLAWITLEVYTRSAKPSRQVCFAFEGQSADSVVLSSVGTSSLLKLPVYMPKRGYHLLPRLKIWSNYPLGIMQAWGYGRFASGVFVYPKPQAFLWQQPASTIAQGEAGMMVAGQDDFDRLDNYQQGESLSRVSWGHMARGMGMLSKRFADPAGSQWCLDYQDMPSPNHEQKLAQLSFAIEQLQKLQVPFVLKLPNFHSELGAGDAFVQQCLLRLAKEP